VNFKLICWHYSVLFMRLEPPGILFSASTAGLMYLEVSSKESFFVSNLFVGMDQHGADSSQPDSGPARPNIHSPAASGVPLYQPADLPRDRHPCPPGSTGMAGKSGQSLRYHHLNLAVLCCKGEKTAKVYSKEVFGVR